MIALVFVERPLVDSVIVVTPLTGTLSPHMLMYLVFGFSPDGIIPCAFAMLSASTVVAAPVSGNEANVK